jgi:hypothetical protein
MATVRRRLLNLLTVLSLLLCVAAVVVLAATCRREFLVYRTTSAGDASAFSSKMVTFAVGRGEFFLHVNTVTFTKPAPSMYLTRMPVTVRYGFGSATHGPEDRWWNRLGFRRSVNIDVVGYDSAGNRAGRAVAFRTSTQVFRIYCAPGWLFVLLTAVLPMRGAVRTLQRHGRHKAGLCPRCGYDLRATPDRCPECGTPGTAIPAASAWVGT